MPTPEPPAPVLGWRAWAAPAGVAILPIVVAAARAIGRGWLPMGDNGYFAIRARDVLTEHHPLVGAWSAGSRSVGVSVNNLGPLQLDWLAVPLRMLDVGAGVVVGVASLNALAAILVVVAAGRRLGLLGAWLGAATVAAMGWTLGSELLIEPRQHHALVLPFLAVVVLAWALADGDWPLAPWAVGMGSLVAQTHLTFVLPVLALSGLGLVGLVRAGGARRRWVLLSAAVLALAWVQPLAEELGGGQGNLTALTEATGPEEPAYGVGRAVRAVATVALPVVGWVRPAFGTFDPADGLLGPLAAAGVLALVVGGLVAVSIVARRRDDRTTLAAVATATVGLVAAGVSAALTPLSAGFGPVAHNFRSLWPVAAMVTLALVVGVVRGGSLSGRRPTLGVAGLAVVIALAALPTSYQQASPAADAPLIPVAEELVDQLGPLEGRGAVLVDRSRLYFGEPFSYVVLAELQARQVPFVFEDEREVARFGDDRRRRGSVTGTVSMGYGDRALEQRPGRERIAIAWWLDEAERANLAELRPRAEADELSGRALARYRWLRDRHERGTVAVFFTPTA